MKHPQTLLLLFLLSLNTFPKTGYRSIFNHETHTFSYEKVDFPEIPEPMRSEGDTLIKLLPGWPQSIYSNFGLSANDGVALSDIDNDDTLEVVVSTGYFVNVYRHNGTLFWSRQVSGTAQSAPSVADINNDGFMEIVQTTRGVSDGGCLYVFDYKGNIMPGWPWINNGNGSLFDSPALSDLNGDSLMEIIVNVFALYDSTCNLLYVFKIDGKPLNDKFPYNFDEDVNSTPAIGDIDNDGEKEVIVTTDKIDFTGKLYIVKPNGLVTQIFPIEPIDTNVLSVYSPFLCDINSDNKLEIILNLYKKKSPNDFIPKAGILILDHKGVFIEGWPNFLATNSQAAPTVVDFYGNNDFNIFMTAAHPDYCIYGFRKDGTTLPNFPFRNPTNGCTNGFTAVADIDNDNQYELIFDSGRVDPIEKRGYIHAYKLNGAEAKGFPFRPSKRGCTFMNGVNLGDLNKDNIMDMVIIINGHDSTGSVIDTDHICAYSLGVPYSPEKVLFGTYLGHNSRDGLYRSPFTTPIKHNSNKNKNSLFSLLTYSSNGFQKIQFELVQHDNVAIELYNSFGRKVNTVFSGNLIKGKHVFDIDKDKISTGVYFIKVYSQKRGLKVTRKVVLW